MAGRLLRPSRFSLAIGIAFALVALFTARFLDLGGRLEEASNVLLGLEQPDPDGPIAEWPIIFDEDNLDARFWSVVIAWEAHRFPGRREYTCTVSHTSWSLREAGQPLQPIDGLPDFVRGPAARRLTAENYAIPTICDMVRLGETRRVVWDQYGQMKVAGRVATPITAVLLSLLLLCRGVRRFMVQRRRARCRRGLCPICRYSLTDLTTPTCPECGCNTSATCAQAARLLGAAETHGGGAIVSRGEPEEREGREG